MTGLGTRDGKMRRYTLRVLIGLDQFVNTLTGGYPNETLSARAWRKGCIEGNRGWRMFQEITDLIFSPFDPDHCELSYLHFQKPTKTCGIYYPIYYKNTDSIVGGNNPIPIDLPLRVD